MTPPRRRQTRALLLLTLTALALALMAGTAFLAWRLRPRPTFVAVPPELTFEYPDLEFARADNAFHDYQSLEPVINRRGPAWQKLVSQLSADFMAIPPAQWTAIEETHARHWIPIYQEGFDVLRRATGRPVYVGPRPGALITFSPIRFLTELAQGFRFDTELALRDGDQQRAADDILVCLRVAAQLPHFSDLSQRRDADKFQDDVLDALSDHHARHRFTDPAAVHLLLAGLAAADADRWPLAQALRAEYAAAREWLRISPVGGPQSAMAAAGMDITMPVSLAGIPWLPSVAARGAGISASRPLRDFTNFFVRKVRALDTDPLRALRDEIAEDRTGIPELGNSLPFNAPARFLVRQEILALARLRGVTLQTALLAYQLDHRAFPASLDALVPAYLPAIPADPFDGQPFRFRRDPGGVTLWSIGPDLTDNGGAQPLTPAWRTLPSGDLVFSLSGR